MVQPFRTSAPVKAFEGRPAVYVEKFGIGTHPKTFTKAEMSAISIEYRFYSKSDMNLFCATDAAGWPF
jgi:hypothetical protein